MTDQTVAVIGVAITAITTLIGTIVTVVVGYFVLRLKAKTDDVAAKQITMEKRDIQTHALVDGNMGVQLELYATVTRRMAESSQLESDRILADAAEKRYRNHINSMTIPLITADELSHIKVTVQPNDDKL